MLTSAKIGKQDGDTRTPKAKLGYLNLSNVVSLFSVKIVKEVMDGLRVYFDFTLASILLYNMERVQHDRVMRETDVKRQNEVKQRNSLITMCSLRNQERKMTVPWTKQKKKVRQNHR